MKARFTNFAKGKELKDMIFYLPKTLSGHYCLDTISTEKGINSFGVGYTLEEIKRLKPFIIKNKKGVSSKYKTSEGFINRLHKELR